MKSVPNLTPRVAASVRHHSKVSWNLVWQSRMLMFVNVDRQGDVVCGDAFAKHNFVPRKSLQPIRSRP